MDLTTHLDLLKVLVEQNKEDENEDYSYHIIASHVGINGDKIPKELQRDKTGNAAKNLLLKSAAHLILAADKITKRRV